MEQFLAFFVVLAGLVPAVAGAAPVIAFLIDTAKRFGLPDGYAPAVSGALNLAAFALLFFGGDAVKQQFPSVAAGFLAVAPYIVALIGSLVVTVAAHNTLVKTGQGVSNTAKAGGVG